jgi:hypothetical protein
MAPRRLLLLPVLGLLGACAAPEERADALRQAFETSRASLAPLAATPVALPVLPAAAEPVAAQPVAATQFLGLGPEGLRRWLGEPSFRRREGTAEIWLYAGPVCALDLVLYPEDGRLRVSHAAARASGTEPRTEAHCLHELAGNLRPADRGA